LEKSAFDPLGVIFIYGSSFSSKIINEKIINKQEFIQRENVG